MLKEFSKKLTLLGTLVIVIVLQIDAQLKQQIIIKNTLNTYLLPKLKKKDSSKNALLHKNPVGFHFNIASKVWSGKKIQKKVSHIFKLESSQTKTIFIKMANSCRTLTNFGSYKVLIDLLCKSIDWFLYEGNTGT